MRVRDSSIHNLSFECELYLSKIKSYIFSKKYSEKANLYHQIQVDKGLGQILPYLVNWIQTSVCFMFYVHFAIIIIIIEEEEEEKLTSRYNRF